MPQPLDFSFDERKFGEAWTKQNPNATRMDYDQARRAAAAAHLIRMVRKTALAATNAAVAAHDLQRSEKVPKTGFKKWFRMRDHGRDTTHDVQNHGVVPGWPIVIAKDPRAPERRFTGGDITSMTGVFLASGQGVPDAERLLPYGIGVGNTLHTVEGAAPVDRHNTFQEEAILNGLAKFVHDHNLPVQP